MVDLSSRARTLGRRRDGRRSGAGARIGIVMALISLVERIGSELTGAGGVKAKRRKVCVSLCGMRHVPVLSFIFVLVFCCVTPLCVSSTCVCSSIFSCSLYLND